jgi:glyoxylase-like metal-dependent hydrolase (beta-lactamase superfamily II)
MHSNRITIASSQANRRLHFRDLKQEKAKVKILKLLAPVLLFVLIISIAQPSAAEDLELQKVTDSVYAIVGELGNRSAKNLGNNATFGFVITRDGVVLIDSGGTFQGARKIDQLIKSVTDKPVVVVINTGGQDHRWLGNGYFKQRGAEIIASEAAVKDQQARTRDQFIMLDNLVGGLAVRETEPVYAETTFIKDFRFTSGNTIFELRHAGPAHTPGDSFVWLPGEEIVFAGDIVYVERMLGVGPQSNSKSWISVFNTMAAYNPRHLIPGHGHATDLAQAQRDTFDYLVFLRKSVADFLEEGGDISDISSVKQTEFSYLLNFQEIAGRNAQQVFTEMEWE